MGILPATLQRVVSNQYVETNNLQYAKKIVVEHAGYNKQDQFGYDQLCDIPYQLIAVNTRCNWLQFHNCWLSTR